MYKSEKFWDRTSKSFDKPGIEYGKIFIKSIENIKKHLDSSDIVLDYACATGAITNEIAGDVKEVHGIDISSKMLAVAKRKAAELTIKNVDFKQSTLSGAGYQKEAFNVILGFNILHLLEDAGKGVQGINELLKPGGLFISATPCLGEEKTFLGKSLFFLSKLGLVPQIRHFQISELEGLIANGDFQIVEAENSSDSPPNYFIVAKKPG